MSSFAERLSGKSVKAIENDEPGFGIRIVFSDGTDIRVFTEVTALVKDTHSKRVEGVASTSEDLTLHLSGGGLLKISTDRERFSDVVELFVYRDDEGFVVEN